MSLRRRRPPQYLELTTTKNGTFAASIARVAGAPACVWKFEDGEEQVGDSCSKPLDGHAQKVVLKIAPKYITFIEFYSQNITKIENLHKCLALAAIYGGGNGALVLDISELSEVRTTISFADCVCLTGSIDDLSDTLEYVDFWGCALLIGSISALSPVVHTTYLAGDVLITGSDVSHMRNLRLAYLQDQAATQARIDAIIQDIWQHRADFTYASGITCNLDGNNAAPSGNVIPPEEGTDWHLDGETWIPLTAGAMVFDLVNDVNSEGFNFWNITVS